MTLASDLNRRKFFLRGYFREKLREMPPSRRRQLARQTTVRAASLGAFQTAQTVGLTRSTGLELDTFPLLSVCRSRKKVVAVPVIFPEEHRMEFSLVDETTRWILNRHGILEPHPSSRRFLDPRNLELLIVPGTAFSPTGTRLGQGGGYFDRFLSRHRTLPTLGMAFDEQITGRLPFGPQDQRVDAVITPTRLLIAERDQERKKR